MMFASARPALRGLGRTAGMMARRGYAEEAAASQKLKLTLAMPSQVSFPPSSAPFHGSASLTLSLPFFPPSNICIFPPSISLTPTHFTPLAHLFRLKLAVIRRICFWTVAHAPTGSVSLLDAVSGCNLKPTDHLLQRRGAASQPDCRFW